MTRPYLFLIPINEGCNTVKCDELFLVESLKMTFVLSVYTWLLTQILVPLFFHLQWNLAFSSLGIMSHTESVSSKIINGCSSKFLVRILIGLFFCCAFQTEMKKELRNGQRDFLKIGCLRPLP